MSSPSKPSWFLQNNDVKNSVNIFCLFFALFLHGSCIDQKPSPALTLLPANNISSKRIAITSVELQMLQLGLVDISTIDSTIKTDIKYSTTDNFLKTDIYGNYSKAYLQKDVAIKLAQAQACLKELHPGYSLLIYDAARPVKFQKMIWDALKVPAAEKGKYASNAKNGSLHNFGAAVDLTIIDNSGKQFDMGCQFDYFNPLAYPVMESQLLDQGLLTQQQIDNRKLLRHVMSKAGFYNIQTEWWHFNSCTREQAMLKYKIIE